MADFLDILGKNAETKVNEGYYEPPIQVKHHLLNSLKDAILNCKNAPIISEIKLASPTMDIIRNKMEIGKIALAMKNGGAIGISVLTEKKYFMGSLDNFIKVRNQVEIPLLMKDIIISQIQIEAAEKVGADAVLLIEPLFSRGYCDCDIHEMISFAHSRNIEVLLEVHTEEEFLSAQKTEADLVGINNRDLRTLEVNLDVTRRILKNNRVNDKLIVSESGIKSPADIRFLYECGARAFLVGSSIMEAGNIKKKVKELVSSV